ncbi:Aspartic peptidase [Gossypium australe]|uniref:Aspartic peptidase n=1 Tax=Gossypium australe TaxID=47621 RepID=A0A5B6VZ63_9ROSI|nr:Aspartic peptidase [Gossypium australe]
MRVATNIGQTKVILLINSGSTHNFINANLVKQLALLVSPMNKLKVIVANGAILVAGGIFRAVQWKVESIQFHTDFYVLPFKECDLVLGRSYNRYWKSSLTFLKNQNDYLHLDYKIIKFL